MKIKFYTCRLLLFVLLISSFICMSASADKTKEKVLPVKIKLPIPENCEMEVGDSRVIDVLFFSGKDNLANSDFKTVTERGINWSITPEGLATIDNYGRLDTLKPGKIEITANSIAAPEVSAKCSIEIVSQPTINKKPVERIVNFSGNAAKPVDNLQKLVDRYSKNKSGSSSAVSKNILELPKEIAEKSTEKLQKITQNNVEWTIEQYADSSGNSYVKRIDNSLNNSNPDKVQYFIGDRYLPDDGKNVSFIVDDENNGIWAFDKSGDATHIKMLKMDYADKADIMCKNSEEYVSRMGLESGSSWNGKKWIPKVSDNDGLWTSMYGGGELMRYAVAKKEKADKEEILTARASALKALKAVLLLSYISGREGTVDAKIRHLTNTRVGHGNKASQEYLKEGAVYAVDNYVGSPDDYTGFRGIDAGKTIEEKYLGGFYRFSLNPIYPNNWTKSDKAATTKRTLKGFIARSFTIPSVEDTPFHDGLFIQRSTDSKQKVLSGADRLYDYSKDDHPELNLGSLPIPDALKDVITLNGKQYQVQDVAYKGDTSTDEIIGHLFIYKIAYDILDAGNPEEKELKKLTVGAVVNYAQHLIDNGYQLVDATGQGTTWGKTCRNYFNSDFTVEDNSLNSLVLLCTFKLAYYMTGEKKWQDEYLLLANEDSFKYTDLAEKYWDHWIWLTQNADYEPGDNIFRLNSKNNPSNVEIRRHALYCLNHSDEEMAMLAYYILFQVETDQTLINKYRNGLEGWWHSCSRSVNPLWNYIYQLAYPKEAKQDAFGNNLVESASWALSRHPVDTRTYQAYVDGSRADVLDDNGISINPEKIIGTRTSKSDAKNATSEMNTKLDPNYDPGKIYQIIVLPQDERSLHKFNNTTFTDISRGNSKNMEAATTYSLPYWMGRYHDMLTGR